MRLIKAARECQQQQRERRAGVEESKNNDSHTQFALPLTQ